MNQSYPLSDISTAVKARLKLAFGARNLTDVEAKLIAEQAGIRLNQLVNDSNSELFSVDSFSEGDVAVPFAAGVYQSGSAAVFAGDNTIYLGQAFPSTNYTIQISIFDLNGGAVVFNQPTNIKEGSFDVYAAANGILTYICIRNP